MDSSVSSSVYGISRRTANSNALEMYVMHIRQCYSRWATLSTLVTCGLLDVLIKIVSPLIMNCVFDQNFT